MAFVVASSSLPRLAVLVALVATSSVSVARADCVDGRPLNVGHRGTGSSSPENPLPENTIPSLLTAGDEGATMVELDVLLSSEMVPVLMHDARVDATTDGMGCVSELTVAELQMLDAGAGTPMAGMGITVPTLAEVLDAVELDLNVEIKAGGDNCPTFTNQEVATAVLDVLSDDPVDRIQTVSSFDWEILDEVRALDPSIYIGGLSFTPANAMSAVDSGFDALNINVSAVDDEAVMTLRDLGLEINVWTVNEPDQIADLFDLDVDSIITDEPPLVEAERADRCEGEGETDGGSTTGDESDGSGSDTGAPGGTAGDESTGGPGDSTETGDAGLEGDGDGEGCGCRASGPSRGWGLLAPLGLLLVSRRRRRA